MNIKTLKQILEQFDDETEVEVATGDPDNTKNLELDYVILKKQFKEGEVSSIVYLMAETD